MSDHNSPADSHGPITRVGAPAAASSHDHGGGHGDHDDHGGDHESHGGIGQYLAVFAALCVLTTMSFLTYSSVWPWRDEPHVGWAFMMAVSCTKAMLVVLFFMHVLWEANWKYVLTIPAAMMAIFLALMLVPDVGLRNRMVAQERVLHMARPADLRLMERAAESQVLADPASH